MAEGEPTRHSGEPGDDRSKNIMLTRWKSGLTMLLAFSALAAGCKQHCFMTECDYDHYHSLALPRLDCDPAAAITPTLRDGPAPADVFNPDRPIRYISLSESVAIALEQGTVGIENGGGPTGTIIDRLASFNGRSVVGSDSIRVLALDPAITGTDIEASLSKFDARWTSSMAWQSIDNPIATAEDVLLAGGRPVSALQAEDAFFRSSLLKPLPSGGVAGITFRTDYELSNLNSPVNPAYRPSLQFQFEQPLLQGFGVEINELRSSHPGSILTPFANAGRVEGILITRLRFDEQRAEFERRVNELLVNVELAYWNLYGAYWNLYSREQGLRQAFAAWRFTGQRFRAGTSSGAQYAQTRQQYELFRGERLAALAEVQEKERQLRGFMGLPVEDGYRLVPADPPALAPYRPDWSSAVNEAMALRPELVLARQEVKVRQLEVINQKNLLLPDLRFTSTYGISGIGTQLDGGSDPNNAFHSLATDRFTDWSLGLRLDVPIGFRDAHAGVRAARLLLAQSYNLLQDQELKAQRYLALQYRRLAETNVRIEAARSQREAAAQQLTLRFQEFAVGRGTLEFLLTAQIAWANALRDEFALVADYNNALATFEFAKGTIMPHDNVVIGEGPLPGCARVRAVEHERERTQALVLRERAKPAVCLPPACPLPDPQAIAPPPLPVLPTSEASSLSTLMENGSFIPPGEEPVNLPRPDELSDLSITLTRPSGSSGKRPTPAPGAELSRELASPSPALQRPTAEISKNADLTGRPAETASPQSPNLPGAGSREQKSEPRSFPSPVGSYLPAPGGSTGDNKSDDPAPAPLDDHEAVPSRAPELDSLSLSPGVGQTPPSSKQGSDLKPVPPTTTPRDRPPSVPGRISDLDSLSISAAPASLVPQGALQGPSNASGPPSAPVDRRPPMPGPISDRDSLAIPLVPSPQKSPYSPLLTPIPKPAPTMVPKGPLPGTENASVPAPAPIDRRLPMPGPISDRDSLAIPATPSTLLPKGALQGNRNVTGQTTAPVDRRLPAPSQISDRDSLAIPVVPTVQTSSYSPQLTPTPKPPPTIAPNPATEGDSLSLPSPAAANH
jgi:outer membrane protein TolC